MVKALGLQWFANLSVYQHLLGGLLKHRLLGPNTNSFQFVRYGVGSENAHFQYVSE